MVLFLPNQYSLVWEAKIEMGVITLLLCLSNVLTEILFPITVNLGFSDLGILVHKGGIPLPGVLSRVPLNLKLKLPFKQFGFLVLLNQWKRNGAVVQAVRNNSNILEKLSYYQIMGLEGTCVQWR